MQTKIIDRFDANLLRKMLYWADRHQYFSYFNPNDNNNPYGGFRHFLSVGDECIRSDSKSMYFLQKQIQNSQTIWPGYFSFDLKNELGHEPSDKPTSIKVPHVQFFKSATNIYFVNSQLIIEDNKDAVEEVWNEILSTKFPDSSESEISPHATTSKSEYIDNCRKIKSDIIEGEYYEINYCIEFIAENVSLDPIKKYEKLNELSPMPFSCLAKFDQQYLISASPERFLKKAGNKVISQPIKGTIKRGKDEQEDEKLKTILRNSQKELAENMMIIDLVRNDLNRSATTGTVKVEEFFGIYSFRQIHQMISTIVCQVTPEKNNLDVIANAFPMGSMTGAPKKRVIRAINKYEKSTRGLYSGAMGYFQPDGDFDFNVVIRSIIYDQKDKKLSFHVGSAITYDADPEYEYEECLLKAKTMMRILSEL